MSCDRAVIMMYSRQEMQTRIQSPLGLFRSRSRSILSCSHLPLPAQPLSKPLPQPLLIRYVHVLHLISVLLQLSKYLLPILPLSTLRSSSSLGAQHPLCIATRGTDSDVAVVLVPLLVRLAGCSATVRGGGDVAHYLAVVNEFWSVASVERVWLGSGKEDAVVAVDMVL